MEWIEVSAKTVPLAIERALDMLGVHDTEIEVETLEEGKSALFGLRKTDARIRARVKPLSREKPQDKRRRKQREERRPRGQRDQGAKSQPGKDQPGKDQSGGVQDTTETAATAGKQSTPQKPRNTGRNQAKSRDARPSRDDDAQEPARQAKGNTARSTQDASQSQPESTKMTGTGTIEEQLAHAHAFGVGLVDAFGYEAEVSANIVADDVVEVAITGENLGLLVGPKAATLSALEELLRGSVGHRGPARLHLDVAGYKQKRREALTKFAAQVADEVLSSGVAKALEPMSAPDRKAVHDAISEIEGVSTISDGEDQRRRVIIQPAS